MLTGAIALAAKARGPARNLPELLLGLGRDALGLSHLTLRETTGTTV